MCVSLEKGACVFLPNQHGPLWPPYPRGEDTPQDSSSRGLEGLSWLMPSTHQNRTSLSEEQLRVAVTAGRIPGLPEARGQAQQLSQVTQSLAGTGHVRGPRKETEEHNPSRNLEPRPWPSWAIFPHARPGPSLMPSPLLCCPWQIFQSLERLRLTRGHAWSVRPKEWPPQQQTPLRLLSVPLV